MMKNKPADVIYADFFEKMVNLFSIEKEKEVFSVHLLRKKKMKYAKYCLGDTHNS